MQRNRVCRWKSAVPQRREQVRAELTRVAARGLFLAMTNACPHPTLLSTEFTTTFTGFLDAHAFLRLRIEMFKHALVPSFTATGLSLGTVPQNSRSAGDRQRRSTPEKSMEKRRGKGIGMVGRGFTPETELGRRGGYCLSYNRFRPKKMWRATTRGSQPELNEALQVEWRLL